MPRSRRPSLPNSPHPPHALSPTPPPFLPLDPATCLTGSYGSLFLAWKQRTGSPAENLTFDEIPTHAVLQPALG
jgi:hypothetical protein